MHKWKQALYVLNRMATWYDKYRLKVEQSKTSIDKNHNLSWYLNISLRGPQTNAPTSRTPRQLIFENVEHLLKWFNVINEKYKSEKCGTLRFSIIF